MWVFFLLFMLHLDFCEDFTFFKPVDKIWEVALTLEYDQWNDCVELDEQQSVCMAKSAGREKYTM